MKKAPNNQEFECCIMCGKLTDIPTSMPIDLRADYEVGVGQLCASCKADLRKESQEGNKLSVAQVVTAIEASREK